MKSFDRVYIGTSPVCCMDAIYNRLKNENITLLDERFSFGGAWTSIEHEDLPLLEIGCHIWSVDNDVFEFIIEFLKIPLVRMNPQPVLLKNNSVIPYDWKVNVISLKRIVSNFLKGHFKAIGKDFSNPAFRFSLFPSKYLYPAKGATSFVNEIENKLKEHGVTYSLNTKVNRIKIEDNQVKIYTPDEIISCSKLNITSLSNIKTIEFSDGSIIEPSYRVVKYIHMHFVLEGEMGNSFSYVRMMDDDVIHRVSNITSQLDDKYLNGHSVIIVGVLEKAYDKYSKEELTSRILKTLKKYKYVKPSIKVVANYLNIYPSYYKDSVVLEEIQIKSKGMVEILPSTDLIYSFSKQLKKWQPLLLASCK